MSERGTRAGWRLWLIVGVGLAMLAAILVLWGRPLYEFLSDQEDIRAWVEGFGAWGPAAIAGLEMAQAVIAPFPGQAIELVGGYLFGLWLGTLWAMVGIIAGSLLSFLLARRFGRPLAKRLVGAKAVSRLDELAQRGGALFFFLLWLLPFVPDDLACLAAGLTPMPVRQFLILMALGRLPGIFVATWVGVNAGGITPLWWAILLGLLVLASLALWRWGSSLQAAMFRLLDKVSGQRNGTGTHEP